MSRNALSTHYNVVRDTWIVDVPYALTPARMAGVQSFLVKTWTDTLRGMAPGDKRDYYAKGLAAAAAGRLEQRMTHLGDQDFFKSTVRENPGRLFSLPPLPRSRPLTEIARVVDTPNTVTD